MQASEIEKNSLVLSLNACAVAELPSLLDDNEDRVWVMGIAKVTKCDNSKSYVVVENDGRGNPFITRDYGSSASIVSIDGVFPTRYLEQEDMPSIRSQKDIIRYLTVKGEDKAMLEAKMSSKDKKDKEDLKAMVYRYSIADLLNNKNKV